VGKNIFGSVENEKPYFEMRTFKLILEVMYVYIGKLSKVSLNYNLILTQWKNC